VLVYPPYPPNQLDPEKWYKAQCETALQTGNVHATEFRHGAIVTGWPSRWPLSSARQKGKRGIIRSMSARSRIRAAWCIANSPKDFDLMTTLTFRERHPEAKECLRAWCLAARLNRPEQVPWGWAMEFQERGVVHFHIVHRTEQLFRDFKISWAKWAWYERRGQQREILQGRLGKLLQDMWIAAVGDETQEFLRFQRGGITERMSKPELTARYLGGYLGKGAQKNLPEDEPPQGRWWWLSPAARPLPGKTLPVLTWPLEKPHRLIHDKAKLGLDWSVDGPHGPPNLYSDSPSTVPIQ
jgi:hypothetical protein